ncbi:hypothetical protein [Streptomyces fungicidicus]|uniref:hypothetical protein n=1 Tax=Streptomyces fungicidicus TaxID=68203 RepID=UPI003684244F
MGEILSYLAVALPADVTAEARLLALQCALRMNTWMRIDLPAGMLRSLGVDAAEACRELEQARWLSMVDAPGAEGFAAQLRDPALLAQPPARPDRRQAADWALRRGSPARTGVAEPHQRLLGVYLTAHSDPCSGEGLRECDQVLRDCGMPGQVLAGEMTRLTDSGVLEAWEICPDSGDAHWTLAPGQR